MTILSAVKDIEQPDILYIAGANSKHWNHFGKQYGSLFYS